MSTASPVLTADRVDKVFRDCLFRSDEEAAPMIADGRVVMVAGIMTKAGFHPARLESHRDDVTEMLMELPPQFLVSTGDGGGGWSFLQACMTKDDWQWGEHQDMDRLFMLGMGLDLVACPFPRDIWPSLPGALPYYVVKL